MGPVILYSKNQFIIFRLGNLIDFAAQNGMIQEDKEKTLTPEKIITMDWLCENVEGRIPKMSELTESAKPVVMEQGIGTERE